MTAAAADNRRCRTTPEILPPNQSRHCSHFRGGTAAASPVADGVREGVSTPAPNSRLPPAPRFSVSPTSAEHLLDSRRNFFRCVLVRTNNQDRVISSNRSHHFLPFLFIQRRRHRLSAAHNRFQYQQVLRGLYIQYELANQSLH